MSTRSNRRQFLMTTALAGAGFWIAGCSKTAESKSPNERVDVACIGLGEQGGKDANNLSKLADIVAICDVDETNLNKAGNTYTKARRYADFRRMFDEIGKSIDAVTVATPDHLHAPVALHAMRMGKHCYCQKPLTRSLYEARLMAEVARDMKVATQMGNQGTAEPSLRKSMAVVRSGTLGSPSEIHVWSDRPTWPQGAPRPKPTTCPKTLNWDLWIGPAPMRPYADGYHPFKWRGWWDFGTGALGDMACHTMNMPYGALDLYDPISVQAECSGHNKDSYPASSKIVYEFAAAGKRPAVKMFWYDGGNLPAEHVINPMYELFKKEIDKEKRFLASGCIIIGDKDTLYASGQYGQNAFKLIGGKPLPDVQFVKSPGHYQEWIEAIKGGKTPKSNFPDYSGPLTETVLLGNLALWAADKDRGETILWDAKKLKSTNINSLEPLIKPDYRPGYTLDA